MLVDRTPKSNMTYYMVRVGFSKSQNYTKCQLSSAEAKNNCILEPPKPHFQFRFRSANSFGKITKMGSQKSHKIIQITLILARTSFLLNSRNIQVCSDSRRVRTLVKKCSKITIYLADMVFDSLSMAYYQKP